MSIDRKALSDTIASRSYWRVDIVPSVPFNEELIENPARCREIARSARVEFRGWDYPHVPQYDNENHEIYLLPDGVGSATDFGFSKEIWSLWRSGQFSHVLSEIADWPEEDWRGSGMRLPDPSKKYLDPLWTLLRATEIITFAGNLSRELPGQPTVVLTVKLTKLMNRRLHFFDPRRHWSQDYECKGMDDYPLFKEELIGPDTDTESLLATARERVMGMCQLFGWDHPSETTFENDQRNLLARSPYL